MKILLLLMCFLIAGCSNKSVVFIGKTDNTNPNQMNLYFDKNANLYPASGIEDLPSPDIDYFAWDDYLQCNQELCAPAKESSDLRMLCDAAETIGGNSLSISVWREAQKSMLEQAAKTTFDRYNNGGFSGIALLVHGFNDEDSRGTFSSLRQLADEGFKNTKPTIKPFYVHINWDGRVSPSGWNEAQYTGPLIGVELRVYLNALAALFKKHNQHNPGITVLTHSSGAYIIAASFGDPRSSWAKRNRVEPSDKYFKHAVKKIVGNESLYKVPHYPAINIGMFAPATPSNSFTGYIGQKSDGIMSENVNLVFSVNENDYALTKGINIQNLSIFGATGMGSSVDLYCDTALPRLRLKGLQHTAIDYSGNRSKYLIKDDHAMEAYAQNTAAASAFMSALLNYPITESANLVLECE